MRGDNPTNSMLVIVTAVSQTNHGIEEAVIVCLEAYSNILVSDLKKVGYSVWETREYLEDGRFMIKETTCKNVYEKIRILNFSI